jgi:predicted DNA-binding transcriptional regulator YafY
MARLDRLFLIVSLLRRKGTLSATDLARECKVSERTIFRDIQTLSGAEVPISFDGGYKLGNDASLSSIDLTTDEMLSLYIGLNSDPVQSVTCFREAAHRALSKIESVMPENINGDYETAKKHVAVQPERNRPHQAAALIFELIRQAIWPNKKIKLHYVSPMSAEEVELTPKALLYKKDGWYLAGLAHKRIRYFRMDMIKNVSLP